MQKQQQHVLQLLDPSPNDTGSERFFLRFLFSEKKGISSFVDEKTSFFFPPESCYLEWNAILNHLDIF